MQVDELSDLSDDGDTLELPDGRTLRLKVEPDDTDPFDTFDTYGRIAPTPRSPWDREGMRNNGRPPDFDGNSEILWPPQNCDAVWWQPPKDGPKRGTPEFEKFRGQVADLVAFGMVGLVLELCDEDDAYGRPIVRNSASLWGIEPFADRDYRAEIVRELADELGVTECDLSGHDFGPFEWSHFGGSYRRECSRCYTFTLDADETDEDETDETDE